MMSRVSSGRSVALGRGLASAWLAVVGIALAATAKGDDAWEAKQAGKRAGQASLTEADLAAIGQRLRRRAFVASSGKPVALAGNPSPTLAAPPALSPRKMRAERLRPLGWDVAWRDGEDTPAFITRRPFAARPVPSAPGRAPSRMALELLEANREVFALAHPRDEVRHAETVRSDDGRLHVRFERRMEGIPVWGEDLVVHMEAGGAFYAFNGRYSPTPDAPAPAARLGADTAVEHALDYALPYPSTCVGILFFIRPCLHYSPKPPSPASASSGGYWIRCCTCRCFTWCSL